MTDIRVLVVDDEEPFRRLLKNELTRKGFGVEVSGDGGEALDILREETFDVLLLDVSMPSMDGITLMKRLKRYPDPPTVVVITGKATIQTAVDAMKNGAFDYLAKPYKLEELEIVVRRAHEFASLSRSNRMLRQELSRRDTTASSGEPFIGQSPAFAAMMAMVRKIAPTDSTVLITGESGVGKELVAGFIWRGGPRGQREFTALNCSNLSDSLLESELFGHEKGAFTAAYKEKYGIVEVADGGTLFLDEIAEMPMALQSRLLRFLDSGEFRRVGGTRTRRADIRMLAATNRPLEAMVRAGTFREDLYYRLNVVSVRIPPLRDRADDIPELVRHFLARYAHKHAKQATGITREAMRALEVYGWPGNVRELKNEIERAVILSDGPVLDLADLTIPCLVMANAPASRTQHEAGATIALEELERAHIARVLQETGGNRTEASRLLGINRKTLYLKLKRYGLDA